MCKIKFVEVSQIFNEEGQAVGMRYLDSWMVISGFNSVNDAFEKFKHAMNVVVTDRQSIILCREDAKRFSKSIANTLKDVDPECADSKIIFKQLKNFIHSNYEAKRIIMNPRTLEYYPLNKPFIINKL